MTGSTARRSRWVIAAARSRRAEPAGPLAWLDSSLEFRPGPRTGGTPSHAAATSPGARPARPRRGPLPAQVPVTAASGHLSGRPWRAEPTRSAGSREPTMHAAPTWPTGPTASPRACCRLCRLRRNTARTGEWDVIRAHAPFYADLAKPVPAKARTLAARDRIEAELENTYRVRLVVPVQGARPACRGLRLAGLSWFWYAFGYTVEGAPLAAGRGRGVGGRAWPRARTGWPCCRCSSTRQTAEAKDAPDHPPRDPAGDRRPQ